MGTRRERTRNVSMRIPANMARASWRKESRVTRANMAKLHAGVTPATEMAEAASEPARW